MATTLLLVRHGQTVWNQENRFRGRANIPLDEVGQAQAEATGYYIAEHWTPNAVYCSPLLRARHTAEAIAAPHFLHERAHPGFLDVDFGAWEGQTEAQVRERWSQALDTWFTVPHNTPLPGGERLDMAQMRAMGALREVVTRHLDATIVVVSHTAINRLMLLGLFDMDIAHFWHLGQGLCAINHLEYEGQDFKLLTMNFTAHVDTLYPAAAQ